MRSEVQRVVPGGRLIISGLAFAHAGLAVQDHLAQSLDFVFLGVVMEGSLQVPISYVTNRV